MYFHGYNQIKYVDWRLCSSMSLHLTIQIHFCPFILCISKYRPSKSNLIVAKSVTLNSSLSSSTRIQKSLKSQVSNTGPWCRFSHCGFTAILSLLSFPPGLDKAPCFCIRVLLGRCCLIQFFSSTNTSTNSKAAMLCTLEHRTGQRKQTDSFSCHFL